ncbi:hypothetical protein CK203_073090 [Vitis vinifera]|uniref:Uncharacterized protein n=1 Tax=Vitis vinifera TaxID=29760 RepID=A0A438BY13_VITVI|nr:hypothetical protein CK203_073090 [Vitis vinifera]
MRIEAQEALLGAGSFLLHQFSMLVNTILVNFGLSEEMHNPVSIFALVGLILAGAALGYWIVRKFVISEDGSVDVGVAQFVKWGMRLIATTFILQSTLDTPLALGALVSCWAIWILITSPKWRRRVYKKYSENRSPWGWKSREATAKHNRAEFLSRSGKTILVGHHGIAQRVRLLGLIHRLEDYGIYLLLAVAGVISRHKTRGIRNQQDYYSTFHKTPSRKKFSKKDWEDFTRESTRQAMGDMVSSPEFTDWIVEHADRIQVLPDDSSDETIGSGSDSTEETAVLSGNRPGLFKWQRV